MSDEIAASLRPSGDWLSIHRETYLRSGGTQGHVTDMTALGGHRFTPNCLIRHKGRKSGKWLINPLVYGCIGGEIAIVGSKGGRPVNPGWYYNILASDTIGLQIATQAFQASWREPEGDEREKVWDFMVGVLPSYAIYREMTERRIPVILLKPLDEIPVFSEDDLT